MIGSSILMFGLGPALLKGNGFWLGVNLTLKLPLFWATVGGLVLRVLAIKLPFNLDKSIEQLGLASIPVALLILGMQLASTKFEIGKDELFASMIRLLLAPLIAYLVGQLIGLRGLDLQVLVLQSAMPTAVNAVVMVAEFGGDPRYVARAIVFSTLVSFFTLPLFLWGFARNLT
jgi:predicted permease